MGSPCDGRSTCDAQARARGHFQCLSYVLVMFRARSFRDSFVLSALPTRRKETPVVPKCFPLSRNPFTAHWSPRRFSRTQEKTQTGKCHQQSLRALTYDHPPTPRAREKKMQAAREFLEMANAVSLVRFFSLLKAKSGLGECTSSK